MPEQDTRNWPLIRAEIGAKCTKQEAEQAYSRSPDGSVEEHLARGLDFLARAVLDLVEAQRTDAGDGK